METQPTESYYTRNREKVILRVKEYRKNNKEIIKLKKRLAYLSRRQLVIEKVKGYYVKNREKVLAQKTEYRRKNKAKILVKNRNRKSLLRSASKGSDVTNIYLEKILNETKSCPKCGKEMPTRTEKHIDHIKPVSVGGLHVKSNIRVICKKCNLSRPKNGNDENN